MEIKGLSEKWYWKAINILKASSRSLPNFSHLWDPQSRSFILHINEIRNPPALDCLAKCWTCCRFLSSQGRVNDPTPVLSDTCFSPLSQSGERGNLRSHEINLGWGGSNHYTWLISVCVRVSLLSPAALIKLTDTQIEAHKGSKKVKLKETIPSDLDWRHDQRDWVSLLLLFLLSCLKMHFPKCATVLWFMV